MRKANGTDALAPGAAALPRRILMTTDTVGGVWNYSLDLVRQLGEVEIEILLATMGGPLRRDQWEEARAIPNLIVRESQFRLEWMQSPWEDVDCAGDWLRALEAQFDPDLIHLNNYVHGSLDWQAPSLVVGHSCVFSWHEGVRGGKPDSSWEEYHRRVRTGLRRSTRVTAPSHTMLRELGRIYGPLRTAPAIHNGAPVDRFVPGSKEPFVLTAGRLWDEAKNIRALESIAGSLPWPVYAAGNPSNPDGGDSPPRNLRGLGQLRPEQLADWLGRAAIFAAPAFYEPFGLSILEAALSGCALVLGDIASLRELWNGAALFVPPSSPERLETAIGRLIRSPELQAEYAARGRRRALRYSPERMRARYLELYAEMLEASRRHSPPDLRRSGWARARQRIG